MYRERLSRIAARVDGAQALILVSADGMPVEFVTTTPSLDMEMLSAELVSLLRSMGDNQSELDVGPVRALHVETDSAHLLIREVGEGFYLILVMEAGAVLGRARFELRRAPLMFAEDL